MAVESISNAIGMILPEVALIAAVCIKFLASPFLVDEAGRTTAGIRHRWGALALVAIGVAAWLWVTSIQVPAGLGPFRMDGLVYFVRGTTLCFGAILSLMLWSQVEDSKAADCQALLLAILAGVNITVAANDLVILFLGLELVSIPTYVLLALPRRERETQESAVKYFLLSIFSSAMVLYGFSLLYGIAGTTHFAGIAETLTQPAGNQYSALLPVAVALIVAGLSFRITAVPFHFYAPDVFQGSPSFAAGMLSFVPKVVGFAALLRVLSLSVADENFTGQLDLIGGMLKPLLAMLAVLTMLVGNLMALRQTNLHRLLAYSSVAHAGYMLVGLTMGAQEGVMASGVASLLFYLVGYGLMTLGVFAVLCALSNGDRPARTLQDLQGLSQVHPVAALMLAVMFFSLAGLPPSGGFLGKMNLFLASWSDESSVGRYLAYLLALNAAISAYYYLRVIATMYLKPATAGRITRQMLAPATVAAVLCTVGTMALFLAPQRVWDAAQMKAKTVETTISQSR